MVFDLLATSNKEKQTLEGKEGLHLQIALTFQMWHEQKKWARWREKTVEEENRMTTKCKKCDGLKYVVGGFLKIELHFFRMTWITESLGPVSARVFVIQRASHSSSSLHENQWGGGHPLCPESHMIQLREWRGWAKHRDKYMERRPCSPKTRGRPDGAIQCGTTLSETRTFYSRLIMFNQRWASAPIVMAHRKHNHMAQRQWEEICSSLPSLS